MSDTTLSTSQAGLALFAVAALISTTITGNVLLKAASYLVIIWASYSMFMMYRFPEETDWQDRTKCLVKYLPIILSLQILEVTLWH